MFVEKIKKKNKLNLTNILHFIVVENYVYKIKFKFVSNKPIVSLTYSCAIVK